MKERPIIFSDWSVQRYKAGKKTQTRRLVTRANSLVNGKSASRTGWASIQWTSAWTDSSKGTWIVNPAILNIGE